MATATSVVDYRAGGVKRPYEAIILLHPDTNLEEQKEIFRKYKASLQTYKGEVFSLETWGKRNLANPIGKLKKAVYFHMLFDAETAAVAEIERTLRINERVLRFMHTKIDERIQLSKYMEAFKKGLQESAAREKEREAKMQARRSAMAAARAERSEM